MNAAKTIVDIFFMGTLTGDIFLELQLVFQNWYGDMGATPTNALSQKAVQVLFDRGFIVAHYGYKGRYEGLRPSDQATQWLYLETAYGRCMEPRDAFDSRLVVDRPDWAEPRSALGVSVFSR